MGHGPLSNSIFDPQKLVDVCVCASVVVGRFLFIPCLLLCNWMYRWRFLLYMIMMMGTCILKTWQIDRFVIVRRSLFCFWCVVAVYNIYVNGCECLFVLLLYWASTAFSRRVGALQISIIILQLRVVLCMGQVGLSTLSHYNTMSWMFCQYLFLFYSSLDCFLSILKRIWPMKWGSPEPQNRKAVLYHQKKHHKNRNWRFFPFWLLEMFLERNQSICIRYLSSADTVFLLSIPGPKVPQVMTQITKNTT